MGNASALVWQSILSFSSQHPWFSIAVIASLQAIVIAFIANAITRFCGHDYVWAHRIWMTAVASMLLVIPLHCTFGGWPISVEKLPSPAVDIQNADDANARINTSPSDSLAFDEKGFGSEVESISQTVTEPIHAFEMSSDHKVIAAKASKELSWTTIAVMIYFIGLLICIGRLVFGVLRLRSLAIGGRQLNENSKWIFERAVGCVRLAFAPQIYVVRGLSIPLVFGIRRATLLVPEDFEAWTEFEQRAVMLHELMHVKRRDVLCELASRVMHSVYWFHPASYYVARKLTYARELATDRSVVNCGENANAYATSLVAVLAHLNSKSIQRAYRRVPAVAMSAFCKMEDRLNNIMRQGHLGIASTRGRTLVLVVICVATVTTLRLELLPAQTGQQIASQNPPHESETEVGFDERVRNLFNPLKGIREYACVMHARINAKDAYGKDLYDIDKICLRARSRERQMDYYCCGSFQHLYDDTTGQLEMPRDWWQSIYVRDLEHHSWDVFDSLNKQTMWKTGDKRQKVIMHPAIDPFVASVWEIGRGPAGTNFGKFVDLVEDSMEIGQVFALKDDFLGRWLEPPNTGMVLQLQISKPKETIDTKCSYRELDEERTLGGQKIMDADTKWRLSGGQSYLPEETTIMRYDPDGKIIECKVTYYWIGTNELPEDYFTSKIINPEKFIDYRGHFFGPFAKKFEKNFELPKQVLTTAVISPPLPSVARNQNETSRKPDTSPIPLIAQDDEVARTRQEAIRRLNAFFANAAKVSNLCSFDVYAEGLEPHYVSQHTICKQRLESRFDRILLHNREELHDRSFDLRFADSVLFAANTLLEVFPQRIPFTVDSDFVRREEDLSSDKKKSIWSMDESYLNWDPCFGALCACGLSHRLNSNIEKEVYDRDALLISKNNDGTTTIVSLGKNKRFGYEVTFLEQPDFLPISVVARDGSTNRTGPQEAHNIEDFREWLASSRTNTVWKAVGDCYVPEIIEFKWKTNGVPRYDKLVMTNWKLGEDVETEVLSREAMAIEKLRKINAPKICDRIQRAAKSVDTRQKLKFDRH